jgi:hypothetical protein
LHSSNSSSSSCRLFERCASLTSAQGSLTSTSFLEPELRAALNQQFPGGLSPTRKEIL